MATPLEIEIMLACYVTPAPAEHIGDRRWHSEAGKEARDKLLRDGLINNQHRATPKGIAWVQAICSVPLPVQWGKPGLQVDLIQRGPPIDPKFAKSLRKTD